MLIRATDKYNNWIEKLLLELDDSQTVVVFSMWGEYINSESVHAKENFLNTISKFKNIRKLHTSGHASRDTLAKVCRLTTPRLAIIPIHSECSAKYLDLDIPDILKNRVVLQSCTIAGDVNINVL